MHKKKIAGCLLIVVPVLATAQESTPLTRWKGDGELGVAATRGSARSESMNARLTLGYEGDTWRSSGYLTTLRAKGEVVVDPDAPSAPLPAYKDYQLTANRYEAGATTNYKLTPRLYAFGALRYENDDFSPHDYQTTASGGIGYYFLSDKRTVFFGEVGSGYRRAREVDARDVIQSAILRGLLDFKVSLTDNTELFDRLLIETGSNNTFAQNDLGVSIVMNERFAIKAVVQHRHNTEVLAGIRKTDSLTTLNLVYTFK